MTPIKPNARFLMCRPEHFAVSYAINPWMDPPAWARDGSYSRVAARMERALSQAHRARRGGRAGAAGRRRARSGVHRQRRGGARPQGAAGALPPSGAPAPRSRISRPRSRRCKARGLVDTVRKLPEGVVLEGAGDCVFDHTRNMFWLGYGQRSDAAAQRAVEELFGVEVMPLELADPRFYHMDTALSPLPRGEVMYVPEAFTAAGLATIRARVPRGKRIEVEIEDAQQARRQRGLPRRYARHGGLQRPAARHARRARLSRRGDAACARSCAAAARHSA